MKPYTINKVVKNLGLSDYMTSLFEKNSQLQIIPVKMNKKRAMYALTVLSKMQNELNILMGNPDDDVYEEYQLSIIWLKNQILKKYSIADTTL